MNQEFSSVDIISMWLSILCILIYHLEPPHLFTLWFPSTWNTDSGCVNLSVERILVLLLVYLSLPYRTLRCYVVIYLWKICNLC
jgi:hypothetical protein